MHASHTAPATMGRRLFLGAALGLGTAMLASCAVDPDSPSSPTGAPSPSATPAAGSAAATAATPTPTVTPAAGSTAAAVMSRQEAAATFAGRPAGAFGLEVKGIALGLPAQAKGAALTFDACGGPQGEGFDAVLIKALRKHQAPATLFINQRWAKVNTSLVEDLAADPLFEIANHGTSHAPLASRGQAAYKIPGTASIAAAYDEVMGNQQYLAERFGIEARFFRSGTAHTDELSAKMVRELGLIPMNFTVNMDAGATFPASTVTAQAAGMGRGDVGIGHFNRPNSGTGKGVEAALPRLLESLDSKGLALVKLSDAF